ncbi:laccase-2-like [Chelonus insularis]|uniref:laccase-2-like n=1 Tax=Chelonus insularis TaxID=460826 RepID=UPI00158DFA6E|nr:laccase-2-like [Chelonus insularis]
MILNQTHLSIIYLIVNFLTIYNVHSKRLDGNDEFSSNEADEFKVYSRSSSRWKIHTYFKDNDDDYQNANFNNRVNFNRKRISVPGQNHTNPSGKFSTPEECARPCEANTQPLTCYYHWTFEYYHTLGGACELCQPTTNTSIYSDCQCIEADGVDLSGIIVANRMYPGPAIQICLGDLVVVDVKNMVPGNEITIHWHGIYQKNWQHYDGVPYLTQCPIPEATTFRYQWRAQNIGSHFWHAHTGLHKAQGLDGAIIIRQPRQDDPNQKLYDVDGLDTIVFLSDVLHRSPVDHFPGTTYKNVGQVPDNFLINGKGQWTDPVTGNITTTPLAVFNVQQGLRYRFRIINAFSLGCPAHLIIQNHNLTIISVDGEDVRPQLVTTVTTFSAERVDVILNANQSIGTYWIQLRGLSGCSNHNVQQLAILRYMGSDLSTPYANRPVHTPGLPRGVIFNEVNHVCDDDSDNMICIKDLQSSEPVHEKILKRKSDVQVFLAFSFYVYDNEDLFKPNTYQRFVVPKPHMSLTATVNNISYINPSSPLISQLDDVPQDQICNSTNLPARCLNMTICPCTHVVHVPLDAVVDIILIDADPIGISHPFHLHGFGYHVMGQGLLSNVNLSEANKKIALELDRKAYPRTNNRPPTKDTLAIASGGYTIVRFIADNPGWWFYHCHFLSHLYNGMGLIFRVGEQEDLPPTPENFPRCGNYVPEVNTSTPKPRKKLKQYQNI